MQLVAPTLRMKLRKNQVIDVLVISSFKLEWATQVYSKDVAVERDVCLV